MAIAAWLLLSSAAAAQDAVHAYDIPAQPLEQAVERFSVISGWLVMYPGDLAAGRSSYPLHANLPPLRRHAALPHRPRRPRARARAAVRQWQ
ncbi:hypothetical protein [Stenotrophomonas pavanii]|uniref:hypothetical protein n=1 Tax=Stenotrophomonas pavanii TaxID=487698 RepID=UPI0039C6FFD4